VNTPVATALVGYRDWVVSGDGRLLSMTEAFCGTRTPPDGVRGAWSELGRVATAFCVRTGHSGLCDDALVCECGLHAYAEPHHWKGSGLLHGVVVAWGRIEMHERGFRAEHARPVAFLDQVTPWLRRGVERYGLPVLSASELVAYARWWGDLAEVE
jgi:hypothetical protein